MTKSLRVGGRKRGKYGNVKVTVGGTTYDSAGEYRRWCELQQLARAGMVTDLVRQPTFVLAPKVVIQGKTKRPLTYRADFGYTVAATGERVVEDFKGVLTQVYKIKRHLMMHLHGVAILETRAAGGRRPVK